MAIITESTNGPRFAACPPRFLVRLAWAVALSAFWIPLQAKSPTAWTLENDYLAVTLSARTGGVSSIYCKATDRTYSNPLEPAEALRLRIPVGPWNGHFANGSQTAEIKAVRQRPASVVLKMGLFATQAGKFPAEVEIRYRLEGDNLVARLNLTNRGDRVIDRIVFPALGASPAGSGDEILFMASGPLPLKALFSANRVRSHHDPFRLLDPTDLRGWYTSDPGYSTKGFDYPAGFSPLHTAWMSYQADGASISWDVRDRKAQTQYAVIERHLERDAVSVANNRLSYEMSWHWFPRVRPGESWESPEVYLKFGDHDWHAIARQHREWLQTWMSKPEPPEAFQSSIGWISQGVTSFDQIPELARRGVAVGAPYFIVYGWYGYGMNHLSYDYYPRRMLGGETGLRRNLAEARALGAYPLAWYNPTTTVVGTPEHLRFGKDWVLVDSHGGAQVDGRWSLFDPDRPPITDDSSLDLNVDMGTPVKEFILGEVRRMVEDYGFSGFEFDQAGKNYVSYSPHSPLPPELSYSEGMREVYIGSREIVRAHDPNGIIVAEGMSDFMNQYADSSWLFEGGDDPFASSPDWIAASTYQRYSVPWATFPARAVPEDPGQANAAFMLNSPLDIFANLDEWPEYASHLKRLHGLKQKIYPHLYGGIFSDLEGFELQAGDTTAVAAKSYLEDLGITVVVINRGGESQTASVDFPDMPPGGRLVLYRLDGGGQVSEGTARVDLNLAPYDVVVLVSRHGDKP